MIPKRNLAVSVLTNAVDGGAGFRLEGVVYILILRGFVNRGAPARRISGWSGRWWTPWGAVGLVAMGGTVLAANPDQGNPFLDVADRRDRAR
ncbi:MAG: serine hydrolase [Rhodopila sp.]|nr:serine hydrolase [Rhodopila sp.]